MIDTDNAEHALFEICLLDKAQGGKVVRANSDQAALCKISQSQNKITISYSQFEGINISALVTVDVSKDSPFMNWNIEVDNNTVYIMDYIDFPNVVVPNDLVGNEGNSRIFWPAQEGVVIEDINVRKEGVRKYRPIEHPNLLGWIGLYPSSAQMQFMAYYSAEGGLYMATHDDQFNIKGIEYCKAGKDGIKMEYHLFTTGAGKGTYKLPYDIVIGTYEGDWYDVANIYCNWIESSKMPRPSKIVDNKDLPDWYFESPVVVTYPVRGEHDMEDGTMPPNALYPYTNALPILDDLGQAMAMQDIYEALMPVLKSGERKPLLGCEAAAAEPFIPYLLFNDNRAAINFAYGTPVPAYQFVNHE